jgi:hypothetical protein
MLPTIRIGSLDITRLIIGGNPFSGGSHFSPELDRAFMDYYSNANIVAALRESERHGINTFLGRGDRHIQRALREFRNAGGTMHWIAQTASELRDLPGHIRQVAGAGAVGIYHHGSRTDALWNEGRVDEVNELLKVTRDCGVLVGLGTHHPEVIEYAEEQDWDVDFYMACMYTLGGHRSGDGYVASGRTLNETYDDADRERMAAVLRATPKPCLAFKILAAGRKCGSAQDVREAFRWSFANIKATDGVVVGMYQELLNQVAMNAALTREFAR